MYSFNMNKTKFRGVDILFTDVRVRKEEYPKYLYKYDCRHGDEGDFVLPVTIEPGVMVNFAGSIISGEPIDLGADGYIILTEEESEELISDDIVMSIDEYAKTHQIVI